MAVLKRLANKKVVSLDTRGAAVAYVAVVYAKDESGKSRQIKRTFATRSEASRGERELLRSRDEGKLVAGDDWLLSDHLTDWLKRRTGLRDSSRSQYRTFIKRANEGIGSVKLSKLTPLDVMNLHYRFRSRGLSERTILAIHVMLKHALADAVKWRRVAQNVAADVESPKPGRRTYYVPTHDDIRRVFAAADEAGIGMFVRSMAYLGMRPGELLSLEWDAIDLDAAVLHIRGGKTPSARRDVAMPPECVEMFEAIRADSGRVFGFARSELTKRWQMVREALGAPATFRLYDIRHAHVSMLIAAGYPITVIAERIGHSSPETTWKFYAHPLPGAQTEMAKSVGKVMLSE